MAQTRRFLRELSHKVKDDNVTNGAAALAYYLMLAIFPAAIFLLSLLPYLPIPNLEQATLDLLKQAMPGEAANLLTDTVRGVVSQRQGGLLSVGALLTLWAASNGMYAVMQQLNITYDVKEGRPFWKVRGTALGLTAIFAVLVVGGLGLVVAGGVIQGWLSGIVGDSPVILAAFAVLRWAIILSALLLAFALVYYKGPDVQQRFAFISPGSVAGVVLLTVASIGFRIYVTNFGKYNATYGALGAVIVLMLWLYITGLVILLGSEVNALVEHFSPQGKEKGEKNLAA